MIRRAHFTTNIDGERYTLDWVCTHGFMSYYRLISTHSTVDGVELVAGAHYLGNDYGTPCPKGSIERRVFARYRLRQRAQRRERRHAQ